MTTANHGWAFIREDRTTRSGEVLIVGQTLACSRYDLSSYQTIRQAIQAGAGTTCTRLSWESSVGYIIPSGTSLHILDIRECYKLLHTLAIDIAQDYVNLWHNTDFYTDELCVLLDGALQRKREWLYYEVDDYAAQESARLVYSTYLQERRSLRPGRNKHKTSPTVVAAHAVARAASLSWLTVRDLFTDSYSGYVEEQFMSFYSQPLCMPMVQTSIFRQPEYEAIEEDEAEDEQVEQEESSAREEE